jgi:hypothetical protein
METKGIILVRISELEKERTNVEKELEKERAMILNHMVGSFNCEIKSIKDLERKSERIKRALDILYEIRDENIVVSDLQEKTLAEQISQIKNKISELFANLADLVVIKNMNTFAHSLIENGFINDEQYDSSMCDCDCHSTEREAIPCCTICARCKKNILIGLLEAHAKICN